MREQELEVFVKNNPRPSDGIIYESVEYTILRLQHLKKTLKKQKLFKSLILEYGESLGQKYYNFLVGK